MAAHVQHNSGNDEWYTPPHIIEAARMTMGGIDLDPASCVLANQWINATRYYTKEDNGLLHEWGGRIWLNPPYGRETIGLFVNKLAQSLPSITAACVLVNNATETQWGQQLLRMSSAVCFFSARIKFLTADVATKKNGLQGQMLCYVTPFKNADVSAFHTHFSPYGRVFVSGT